MDWAKYVSSHLHFRQTEKENENESESELTEKYGPKKRERARAHAQLVQIKWNYIRYIVVGFTKTCVVKHIIYYWCIPYFECVFGSQPNDCHLCRKCVHVYVWCALTEKRRQCGICVVLDAENAMLKSLLLFSAYFSIVARTTYFRSGSFMMTLFWRHSILSPY